MVSDIDVFYRTIVYPFTRDFESARSDLRRAYGAAWALDSYASHIFYFYKPNGGFEERSDIDFKRKSLCPKSKDFKTILDVSAAVKHATRSKPDKNKMSIYTSADVTSRDMHGLAAFFGGLDQEEWGEQVIINNDQHLFVPLLPIALNAEKFLIDESGRLASNSR